MSNYRRLISYIYAYEGAVKGKNIGFAKLEARNGQCRISVSVKKVYVGGNDLGVYLLSAGGEILLGKIFIRSGAGEFRTAVKVDNVEESGKTLDSCYGLTIHDVQDSWRAYTTIWDDAVAQDSEDTVAYAAEIELAGVTSENLRREGKQEGTENEGGRAVTPFQLLQAPPPQITADFESSGAIVPAGRMEPDALSGGESGADGSAGEMSREEPLETGAAGARETVRAARTAEMAGAGELVSEKNDVERPWESGRQTEGQAPERWGFGENGREGTNGAETPGQIGKNSPVSRYMSGTGSVREEISRFRGTGPRAGFPRWRGGMPGGTGMGMSGRPGAAGGNWTGTVGTAERENAGSGSGTAVEMRGSGGAGTAGAVAAEPAGGGASSPSARAILWNAATGMMRNRRETAAVQNPNRQAWMPSELSAGMPCVQPEPPMPAPGIGPTIPMPGMQPELPQQPGTQPEIPSPQPGNQPELQPPQWPGVQPELPSPQPGNQPELQPPQWPGAQPEIPSPQPGNQPELQPPQPGAQPELSPQWPGARPEMPPQPGAQPELPSSQPGTGPEFPLPSPEFQPEMPSQQPGNQPELQPSQPGAQPELPPLQPELQPEPPAASPAARPELSSLPPSLQLEMPQPPRRTIFVPPSAPPAPPELQPAAAAAGETAAPNMANPGINAAGSAGLAEIAENQNPGIGIFGTPGTSGTPETPAVSGPTVSAGTSASRETPEVPVSPQPAQEVSLPDEPEEDPESGAPLDPEISAEAVWSSFRKQYPKIDAFDYENGCEILKICPQDIGLLPRENWTYGNNSFLLHGYYNYRCLILVRLNNPGGRARFLLGVPGHYFSNEKYMASMFGFPHFVLSKKQPLENGRFGYWYTDVRLGQ